MSTREVVRSDEDPLSTLALAAQEANTFAQANTLEDYQQGKAENTLACKRDDIALFESYLA